MTGQDYDTLKRDAATREFKPVEEEVTTADGKPLLLEVLKRPFMDNRGEIAGWVGVARDITDYRNKARTLAESLSLSEATLDTIDSGVLVVDSDGRVAQYNERFLELWRVPESLIARGSSEELVEYVLDQLADPEEFKRKTAELYANPWARSFDILQFKDGRVFERLSRPMILDGNPHARVWSFTDVTEKVQALTELENREAFLDSLLDSIPIPVQYRGTDNRYLGVNKAFEDLTRLSSDELVGRTPLEVFGDRVGSSFFEGDEKILEEGGHIHLQVSTEDSGNSRARELVIDRAAFPNADGEIGGIIGTMQDITEAKRASDALQQSESKLRSIFNSFKSGALIVFNADGVVEEWSKGAEILFGFSAEDIVGSSVDLILPDQLRKFREQLGNLEPGDDEAGVLLGSQTLRILRANGTEVPVQMSVGSWQQQGENYFSAIVLDMTERESAEAQRVELLNRTRKRVRELRCLYSVAEAAQTTSTLANLFRRTMDLLPPAWQYANSAMVRIAFRGDLYCSPDFAETQWRMGVPLEVKGEQVGALEIFYRDKHPDEFEGPFLAQERDLLEGVARTLNQAIASEIAERDKDSFARQLRHVQKMEAIGQLSGGIAHDFNNILNIISANVDLLEMKAGDGADESTIKRLGSIKKSTTRAADLTRRLLMFSNRGVSAVETVNLNNVIEDMKDLISRSVTPQVEIQWQLAEELWPVNIDTGDFEDALLNLVLNAHDAMSGSGTLTIKTENCEAHKARHHDLPDNISFDHVKVTITDTGCGMSEEQIERIFEPFYTTKEKGQGTGLGLAMVFGFVQRSGGMIDVKSIPEEGSCFELVLRRREGEAVEQLGDAEEHQFIPEGSETVLVVDDEPALREVTVSALGNLGYRVFSAGTGAEALELLRQEPVVHLVFSDVVMPGGMNGYELVEQVHNAHPNTRTLLATGYAERRESSTPQKRLHERLLMKPYSIRELATSIRHALDSDT